MNRGNSEAPSLTAALALSFLALSAYTTLVRSLSITSTLVDLNLLINIEIACVAAAGEALRRSRRDRAMKVVQKDWIRRAHVCQNSNRISISTIAKRSSTIREQGDGIHKRLARGAAR